MNKNTGIVIGVLVLIIGGIYASKNLKDDSAVMEKNAEEDVMMEKENEPARKEEDSVMKKEENVMMKAGSYEAYSSDKLALADSGDVVLFFRASWCPTCRALDADIRANLGNIPEGVTILDVNYDNSTALKQKYGVTYQHTLVQVDSSGNMITKWTNSPTLVSLITNIK